ncbi:MAG: hypothetical protein IJV82_05905 [Oscillospiraceae bacterium]|nr:hypothetical protein [Oscillospiraceae bacterium]
MIQPGIAQSQHEQPIGQEILPGPQQPVQHPQPRPQQQPEGQPGHIHRRGRHPKSRRRVRGS